MTRWSLDPCAVCAKPSIAFRAAGVDGAVHYRHEAGCEARWHWSKGASSPLYFAGERPHAGSQLHVIEGETDTHALHAIGLPVVGVLGSSSIVKALDELGAAGVLGDYAEIIVWRERGKGGEAFAAGARRAAGEHSLTLRIADWPLSAADAREMLAKCAAADRVTLSDDVFGGALSHLKLCAAIEAGHERVAAIADAFALAIADIVRDAPYAGAASVAVVDAATAVVVAQVEVPGGWRVTDRLGVEIDAGDSGWRRVIPTPLMIEAVEVDAHDGDERLALRWKSRGHDRFLSAPREVVASTRKIVDLASTGLPVTSENARGVVRWLHELEHANAGAVPRSMVARRAGWAMGRHINRALDMSLDDGSGSARLLSGLEARGEAEESIEFVRRVLERHPMAACMCAASLAAAILHPIGLRGFALHLWGDSRGGKTAALKIAMSLWGDPIRLMGSWSATENAIEAHAATLCDLPTALDELQAAKSREHIAQTIYSLANGVGRARATMTGDLGTQRQWRTVTLTTGEMPLLPEDAHDGARTRTIDIHAAPFAGEYAGVDAAMAHDVSERSYGHIGPAFAAWPILSPANRSMLRDEHESACGSLREIVRGDVPPIKLRSAGAMVVALHWLREHVGASEGPAALQSVAAMLSVAAMQAADDDSYGTPTWKVCQQIMYLTASRRIDFTPDGRDQLGRIETSGPGEFTTESVAWLTVPAAKLACEKAGVPYRRALALLHEAGVTDTRLAEVKAGVMGAPARLLRISLDRMQEVAR
ncbi:MAG: DUF927 domain-containing protein [Gemmatimonadaceae bacterium]|nr:DUF927 domain-containing protein [Gemmatimonadaceae bacterium]